MSKIYLIAAALLFTSASYGQAFVNGSFESTNTGPGSCAYLQNAGFSTYTNGADTGFGTANNIAFFRDSTGSCNYKSADGKSSISLTANTTKYDAIALKVSPAMQANKTYTVTFKYKSQMSPPVVTMLLGYSASNNSAGTLISNVPVPSNGDSVWKNQSYTFTPTISCSWITLQANITTFAGYSFVELDKFVLIPPSTAGIDNLSQGKFVITPNPASGYAIVTTATNEPVHINLVDMTGRILSSADHTPQNGSIKVNIHDIPDGTYVLQITNGQYAATERLQVLQ